MKGEIAMRKKVKDNKGKAPFYDFEEDLLTYLIAFTIIGSFISLL